MLSNNFPTCKKTFQAYLPHEYDFAFSENTLVKQGFIFQVQNAC